MKNSIVIDNGSGVCKAGFSGDNLPKSVFSSVIGRPKIKNLTYSDNLFIGNDAQKNKEILTLTYPIEHGIVTNWDDMEKIWQHIFQNELKVSSNEHPVLLTEPTLNPKKNREKMSEIMFEKFNTPALYVAIQAILSLYSSGRTTGIVLDSGDGVSHIVPIYEGFALPDSNLRINLAGRDLTHYLKKLLAEKGHSFVTTAENEIVRDIKEKLCYISLDFDDDLGMAPNLGKNYRLPDGQMISIDAERIKCPEALFKPSLINLEYEGIHKLVYNSIYKSPIEVRKELFNNIIVTGGTTLFDNFQERLQNELIRLVPRTVNVRVCAQTGRQFSVWIGGSVLTLLSSFSNMWVTREEYAEYGPVILNKKCI